MLCGKVCKDIVISDDSEVLASFEIAAPFFKGFDDTKKFLFACGIVLFC